MDPNLHTNLDTGKADTFDADPDHLIIHGPTWNREFPFDELSRELLAFLERSGWTVMRSRAGVHAISPFLRQAA